MQMSMLQTLLADHQREIDDIQAEIAESREIAAELHKRLEANNSYFKEVCEESIRASTELLEALMMRERQRCKRLEERLSSLQIDERPRLKDQRPDSPGINDDPASAAREIYLFQKR